MSREHAEIVVVGSGAGGGVVASRLAEKGRRVVLLESGGYHPASTHDRFELRAARLLWNPPRFGMTAPDGSRPVVMVSGRGVGGSTLINTKIGMRAVAQDHAKWHAASGLVNERGEPFSAADLDPWYEQVEQRMGVRPRTDWTHSVRTVERGFRAVGASLEPVTSYTNADCESIGSCTAGCPTNAGGSALNRYIHPAMLTGRLDVRPGTLVGRVRVTGEGTDRRVAGVDYVDGDGAHELDADVVVLAAGSLVTPQLLQRSGLAALDTPSARLIGRNLGTHTARMVHGVFDDVMDTHVVYPLTAHCRDFARDEDGGFIVEATTILDPVGLASNLVDEHGRPLWGERLASVMRRFRHMTALMMMTNDSNTGVVEETGDLTGRISVPIPEEDQARLDRAHEFCERVLREAGAREVVSTGYITSHVQGSCRMGSDPRRSVCDANQRMWDVDGLYLGDASVIPRTLTYNPSLTIMALAERLAAHLAR
ncbi:GMC family oxidoreductase [Actinomadura miaoliensis]|uniref:GMC family oxidoreductase n=1 Tax=Actinomadura miaoliensis TaxID=430685 RepID=UPI0031E6EC5E